MRIIQIATALLMLAGCASTIGVQPAGDGSWVVSEMRAPVLGGGPAAQAAALQEADFFCRQNNRVFTPIEEGPGGNPYSPYGPVAYSVRFSCEAAAPR